MKTILNCLLGAAAMFVIGTGCSKDKVVVASRTELISKQPWILTAYTTKRLSDGVVQDAFAPMSPCYRDDQYVFKADYTYEGNAGATKCSPSDPQVFQTGTWQFKNNETVLQRVITTGTGIGSFEFIITSLTATELKVHVEDGTYDHVITYAH